MIWICKIISKIKIVFLLGISCILLSSCSNISKNNEDVIIKKVYSQLSVEDKSEISNSNGTIRVVKITQDNIGRYNISKDYIGKTVKIIIFSSKNEMQGNIEKVWYNNRVIGQAFIE